MFGVDVRFGHHVAEQNGQSLQNWANAGTGVKYVKELYGQGVQPKDVVYLVFYKAQKKLVRSAFHNLHIAPPGKLVTVDIFQGQEGSVVVLNTVIGSVLTVQDVLRASAKPSAHAIKPARLNIGITRAVDACIVLYNGDYITRYAPNTALGAMVENFEKRQLVCSEEDQKDGHPQLAQIRQKHYALFHTKKGKLDKEARLKLIRDHVKKQAYGRSVDLRHLDMNPDAAYGIWCFLGESLVYVTMRASRPVSLDLPN